MNVLIYFFFVLFGVFAYYVTTRKGPQPIVTSNGIFSPYAKTCRPKEYKGDCQVCDKRPAEGESLKRCSVCKNKYYCSSHCQKRDWNKHKTDCSFLPPDPIELPISFVPLAELDSEVKRARKMLVQVWNEIEEAEKAGPLSAEKARRLPAIQDILSYSLPPILAYPNKLSLAPLAYITASLSRLFLLHDVARIRAKSPSDEAFAKALEPLDQFFGTLELPSDFPQLLGTKIVRRPGELSPGEYHVVKQVIMMKMAVDDKESAEKWYDLLKVTKKIGG